MNDAIVWFFVFGAVFGLATYSKRHLFSEGPTVRAADAAGLELGGRLVWALVSSCLWPILVLTGLYSLRRLALRRVAVTRGNRR